MKDLIAHTIKYAAQAIGVLIDLLPTKKSLTSFIIRYKILWRHIEQNFKKFYLDFPSLQFLFLLSPKDLNQEFTNFFFLCFSHLYSREHNREKDARLIFYVCPLESIVGGMTTCGGAEGWFTKQQKHAASFQVQAGLLQVKTDQTSSLS